MALDGGVGQSTTMRIISAIVPLMCGLLFAFVANIPISLASAKLPPPLLAMVPVYFWCLVRPDLMTPAATFIVGLMEDVLSGGPPGVWTLAFVLTYALVARQRDSFASLSGLVAVLGFAAAAAFACAVAWSAVAVLALLTPGAYAPPIGPMVSELVVTILFYAPTVLLVGFLHRRLVGPLRSDV